MNIGRKIKGFIYGLMYGLKITENEILTQNGGASEIGSSINQDVNSERLSYALRKGEVTTAVEELRYRTYEVIDKSTNYEYVANGIVVKKDKDSGSRIFIDESDNLPLQLIQYNEPIVNNVLDELNEVGIHGKSSNFIINCERELFPRYRIEEFTKKLVVKRIDVSKVQLQFYVSKYPIETNFISKGFITEVNNIKENNRSSDILMIDKVWFISQKAYGSDDLMKYEYIDLIYDNIIEFDGNYIIKFNADIVTDGSSLKDKFYSHSMANKYETKEKKELVLDLGNTQKVYFCSNCGIKMNMYDAQFTEIEFGKPICIDCLKKQ